MTNVLDQAEGRSWSAFNSDCVPFTAALPENSIDFSVYSPPFSSLYIYSESVADMGNCANDAEFFEQYRFLVREKFRVTRPGRMTAIHVKDLVYYQNSSERGTSGLRPFSDDCTRIHIEEGWDFHSRITIWRDPVREMQKTKAHGLLWKTLRADSTFSRMGLPEYLLVFRKWAKDGEEAKPVTHTKQTFPVEEWQNYASPVWNYPRQDLPETDVLNVKVARSDKDEKHLCPMPLNITRRALRMWSSRGDVVFSPFMGIGSEGVVSMEEGRRFIGTELNPAYFRQSVKNLADAENSGALGDLFQAEAAE
ncbi:MAG: site-specific DNA-methyltransferase [Mesorhizobium sp.]|uniref:DNA-methyltransferase n=1 Tax=Mesorhizobium sp. TaxID=1871066 RepID=UPI00122AA0F1|nr:DNA methyltransferase [Mesorhizobium sp.]TIP70351.1 MAG: site-specific DNA-methyltransferase [Mesorhizobium sp.]TIQ06748.1 MAG: site-specific DNA-methyltransferase [Mesorhizobium sp.]TIR48611.1 MAG: site-specific DNA-methyltransferase [Mesorhizobium sp.]TJV94700.1 MAG: site-specific DNA-methyltransferase [Mesorhizobium sp.]